MPRRWVPVHEDIKVPVFKNVVYAVKIIHKADKLMIPSVVISRVSGEIFSHFIRGILFLKMLLGIIENECSFEYYLKILFLFIASALINEVIIIASDYVQNVSLKRVIKGLNNLIFKKAGEVDISCYEDPDFYDSYQRATQIITGSIFMAFVMDFSTLIGDVIALSMVIGVVTSIDPSYLIFLAPIVIVFAVEIFKSKLLYKRDLSMTKNQRIKQYTQRTVFLKDFSKDMRTSGIFSVIIKRFNKAVEDNIYIIKNYGVKLFLYSLAASVFGEFIPIVGTYSLASYKFINDSGLAISGFSVVLSSINTVRQTTTGIADSLAELTNMALYFQNLRDFFDYESKVVAGEKEAGEFESLEFKNVSFKYPHAKQNSINGISFKINKGETVALVGVNGAGKTTLVKLMLRFYDVTEGEILYNGINIKEYNSDSLRRRFATVFQDYKTFALSVNENVLCREVTDEDGETAEIALKSSGAWDKIKTFPDKGDTLLTKEFDENGAGLSGGEQQKIAVARMFAKNFDIAILDEPSSALDPIAEYNMYENLIKGTRDKTVIYISHRLSSAVLSDRIIVIGGGRLLESGTHSQLMENNGNYAEMFTLQASRYREEAADNAE